MGIGEVGKSLVSGIFTNFEGITKNFKSTSPYWNFTTARSFCEDSLVQCDISSEDLDLEELQAEKTQLESSKSSAQSELSSINSGSTDELSALKGAADTAWQNYQNSLSNDARDNPELADLQNQEENIKTSLETNSTNISDKQTQISENENNISAQETVITGLNGELAVLINKLNSIPNDSTEEGSEDANAQLQNQRDNINSLITLKKQEITLAENQCETLKNNNKTLSDELQTLNNDKQTLEKEQEQIQKSIRNMSSELTKQYQTAYNDAKENFETQKSSAASEKQNEIDTLQTQINEVNKQISAARKQQYSDGDYSIDMDEAIDVFKNVNSNSGVSDEVINAVSQAFYEIGINEGSTNNAGDVLKYGGKAGDAWCASFVSWLYGDGQGNDNSDTFGYQIAVRSLRSSAENAGYYSDADSYEPSAGDIMIQQGTYYSGGELKQASHTGIIVKTDDEYIYTIEGNAGDAVRAKKYAKDGEAVNKISGYVRMNEWNGSLANTIGAEAIPNSEYEDADKDLEESTR